MAWSAVNSIPLISQLFNREHLFTTQTQRHREQQKLEPQRARRYTKDFCCNILRDPFVSFVVAFDFGFIRPRAIGEIRTHLLLELLERRASSPVQKKLIAISQRPLAIRNGLATGDWRLFQKNGPGIDPGLKERVVPTNAVLLNC